MNREERTDKVIALEHLLSAQKESKYPDQFNSAIKRMKWELLGMYKSVLNTRIPKGDNSLDKPVAVV